MANPVLIDCPEGQWTKVATNVTSGIIHVTSESPAKDLAGNNVTVRVFTTHEELF